MRRLSIFQILAIALVVIAAILVLFIGIIVVFQDNELSEIDRLNTAIPLTNDTWDDHLFLKTAEVLDQMATATYDALTAEAAITPTPSPSPTPAN